MTLNNNFFRISMLVCSIISMFWLQSLAATNDPAVGTLVGSIPGKFAVSSSGGATYTIPIECPSGVNGMQPAISLVYNSQGGNGIAGWGWNISGISAINRAPKSVYYDGENSPVAWDNTCSFSLDGQRLIEEQRWLNGTKIDSIEYRTENESYNRIVAVDILAWGPTYFKVYTKAGMKMIYGNSESLASYSPVYTNAATDGLAGTNYERSSWNLVEMVDNNGNYIQYEYITSLNSKVGNVIRTISYGSNKAKAGTSLQVIFDYESRTDNIQGWISGKEMLQQLRLKTIQTKVDNVEQRLYTLTYGTGTISRPTSIEVKHNGTAALNPLTFVYGNDNTAETSTDISFITKDANNTAKTKLGLTAIDVDGDGVLEIGDIYASSDSNFPEWVSSNFGVHYKKDNWTNTGYFPLSSTYSNLQKGLKSNFGDFNGNGSAESVYASKEGNNLRISIRDRKSDASLYDQWVGTTTTTPFISVGNFHGNCYSSVIIVFNEPETQSDGTFKYKYNLLMRNNLGVIGKTADAYFFVSSKIKSMSVENLTGENLRDQLWLNLENGTNVLLKNNYNMGIVFSSPASIQVVLPFNIGQYGIYRLVDMNRDGLVDVIYRENTSNWKIAYNKGDMTFDIKSVSITCPGSIRGDKDNIVIVDINNDGLLDIVVGDESFSPVGLFMTTTCIIYLNSGNNIFTSYKTETNQERASYSCIADVYGNGKMYWVHSPSSGVVKITDFGFGINKNQLTHVIDPLQGDQTIEYKTLADCTEYDTKTDGIDGISDYLSLGFQPFKTSAFSLVSRYTAGLINQTYHYGCALYNWAARGFVGFRYTGMDDQTAGISTFSMSNPFSTTTNGYTGPYLLLPRLMQTSSLTTGQLSSEIRYNYSVMKTTGTKKILTTLDSQTETNNLKSASSINTTFEYDIYGNVLSVLKSFTGASRSEQQQYIYGRHGAWCLNKPDTVTVTQTAMDVETYVDGTMQSTITRVKAYAYDNKGNLTSETADPNTTNSLTTQYGVFDEFGHPTTVTVTANGNSRVSSMIYRPSGRFIQSKTNVLGETTTYTWDEGKGLLTGETNPLGTKSYTYNVLNQLTGTTNEDGTSTGSVTQWATPGNTMGAKFYKYSTASGVAPEYRWYNANGQEIRKETFGLNNNKISVSTEYDDNARVYRVSEPYFDADASTKKWATTNTYDEFGRISTITSSDTKTISYTYDGLQTTVESPEGTTETTDDGYGNVLWNIVNGKTVYQASNAAGQPWYSVPESADYYGSPIKMEYDLQGNRTRITDPDAGVTESSYNGFGELIQEKRYINSQISPVITTYTYDNTTGRLLSRKRGSEITSYTYDPVRKGRVATIEIVGKNKQTFTYDNFDRVTNVREEIGAKIFNTTKSYDTFGRILRETYPSGYWTQNVYDINGNLTEITDQSGRSVWKAGTENAKGQLLSVLKGTKTVNYTYYDNGLPHTMTASGVVDMEYVFDGQYNLSSREDKINHQKEVLGYDTQNRLTSWTVTNNGVQSPANTLTYDDATDNNGNIRQRSDLGNYVMNYGENNNKPHALTSIQAVPQGTSTFSYQLIVGYTTFNKVSNIFQSDGYNAGSGYYELTYGVDEQRRKSVFYKYGLFNVPKLTRYYVGNYEEETDSETGNTKKIHYLRGAVLIKESSLPEKFYYSYSDYQGSLIALANAAGAVQERYAYNPWGERRNPTNWTQKDYRFLNFIVNRGYTGHEHIDGCFGVINMNGRVYDPVTAQFYSPDPQLQSPGNWLNYNRYGYCYGNPFKYTDPSGEFVWIPLVAAIVMNAVIQGGTAKFNGGNFWQGAIKGAFMGVMSAGIGAGFGLAGQAFSASLGIHGTFGVAAASGVFGFAGTGATSWVTTGKWNWNAALVGGATAALYGGIQGYNEAEASGRNVWWGTESHTSISDVTETSGVVAYRDASIGTDDQVKAVLDRNNINPRDYHAKIMSMSRSIPNTPDYGGRVRGEDGIIRTSSGKIIGGFTISFKNGRTRYSNIYMSPYNNEDFFKINLAHEFSHSDFWYNWGYSHLEAYNLIKECYGYEINSRFYRINQFQYEENRMNRLLFRMNGYQTNYINPVFNFLPN